ncbi:hypothetical protein [Ralstonia syzygii]|uniref:hypothetical protein n=1 Tax=Ralstonia syzygii TaxID=28097 RepID=UPI0018D0B81E|nr:hypothetical protein [Ralstonia syzygii]
MQSCIHFKGTKHIAETGWQYQFTLLGVLERQLAPEPQIPKPEPGEPPLLFCALRLIRHRAEQCFSGRDGREGIPCPLPLLFSAFELTFAQPGLLEWPDVTFEHAIHRMIARHQQHRKRPDRQQHDRQVSTTAVPIV